MSYRDAEKEARLLGQNLASAAQRDTSAADTVERSADVYAVGLKAGALPGREWSIMDGFAVRPAFNGGMIVTDLYQSRWIAAFSDLDDFMIWVTGEHAKRTSTRD